MARTTSTPTSAAAVAVPAAMALSSPGALRSRPAAYQLWALPALICVVGGIDLVLTVHALESGWLSELNPIAARVIEAGGAAGLVAFRLTMTSLGAGLLRWALQNFADRDETLAESRRIALVVRTGVGVLVATHVALLFWWAATLAS